MPYIKRELRTDIDTAMQPLTQFLWNCELTPGELNYLISKLVWRHFDKLPSYSRANELLGVLSGVSLEFYRRRVAELEQIKMAENGDIA